MIHISSIELPELQIAQNIHFNDSDLKKFLKNWYKRGSTSALNVGNSMKFTDDFSYEFIEKTLLFLERFIAASYRLG